MNVNLKQVFIDPTSSPSPFNITQQLRVIKDRTYSYKVHGIEFDSTKEVDDSALLTLTALTDVLSLRIPSSSQLKQAVKQYMNKDQTLSLTSERKELKLRLKGRAWVLKRGSDMKLVETEYDHHLDRALKTTVRIYPGLSRVRVGEELFFSREPIKDFDGNEWAFALAGDSTVEIFSNGSRYLYHTKPLRIKFGSGGLYIVNASGEIQNVFDQKYGESSYSKLRQNRQSRLKFDTFDLVSCGKVMVLIETNNSDCLRITSISPNMSGELEVRLQYWDRKVVSFGGYSEGEQLVAFFLVESNGETLLEEHRFALRVC